MQTALSRSSLSVRAPKPAGGPRAARTSAEARRAWQEAQIVACQPLVDALVQKALARVGYRCDADELRSAGLLGLVEAVQRWDPARGIPLEAFARHRISGAILDELRSKDRLDRPARQRARGLETVRQQLVRKLGREPEEAELARATGEDLDTFRRLAVKERAQSVVLLDDLPTAAWDESLAANEPSALDRLCEVERRVRLAEAIRRLPQRTQTILSLYYQEDLSYREIGEMLGVGESRVCQIIKGAQKQLRAELASSEA